eukprot:365942-Chlamydomonas_euryale.AAC.78
MEVIASGKANAMCGCAELLVHCIPAKIVMVDESFCAMLDRWIDGWMGGWMDMPHVMVWCRDTRNWSTTGRAHPFSHSSPPTL